MGYRLRPDGHGSLLQVHDPVLAAFGPRPSPANRTRSRPSAASACSRELHITTRLPGATVVLRDVGTPKPGTDRPERYTGRGRTVHREEVVDEGRGESGGALGGASAGRRGVNAGDAAGVAELYEPQAALAYPADRLLTGWEDIQAIHRQKVDSGERTSPSSSCYLPPGLRI